MAEKIAEKKRKTSKSELKAGTSKRAKKPETEKEQKPKARNKSESAAITSIPAIQPIHTTQPRKAQELKLKKNHYYIIYSLGFFLLALAVFVFLKNITSTIIPEPGTTNVPVQVDFSEPATPESLIAAQELQDLLMGSAKMQLLPKDYKIQIYFYDGKGNPRPDMYYTFREGKVTKGKLSNYELSIATNMNKIPELKRSTNFCLVMETIWVKDQDIKIEYGISEMAAFARYGNFASECVPSAMQSITGYVSLIDAMASADVWSWKNFGERITRPDTFFWYVVLLVGLVIGIRSYLDMMKGGY